MSDLNTKVWVRLAGLAVVMALLLFVPTGTLRYWQAWLYLAVFFGAAIIITLYLMKHDPALLERRLRGGPTAEKEPTQKLIMLFACIGFIALLVVPALDVRHGWSMVPVWVVIVGAILVAVGFYVTFLVYKENSFSAATIQIAPDHRVVSTGPYARVRHPTYAGGLIYCIGTPLALGSYWGLLAFAAFAPVLVWRLLDEEKFLARNLPGYTDYQRRVRWRLIPGIF
jgi:protein-S-isoprenylcysteine O-methyltransferase Ste14